MRGDRDQPASSGMRAGCQIMIVDDDRDFADTLAQLLKLEGCKVEVAYSLKTGHELLARSSIDIALIDIRLGDGSGLDLLATIKTSESSTTCIMMTAYASVDTAVATLKEGAYDYLRKPFYTEDLLAAIDRCLERRSLISERDRAEAALRARNHDLELLNRRLQRLVSSLQKLSSCTDLRTLSQCLLEQAIALTTAIGGAVTLRGGEKTVIERAGAEKTEAKARARDFPMLGNDGKPIGTMSLRADTGRPVTDEDGELVQILVSYASEAFHLLQALDRVSWSELRLRDIIDHSPSLISLQDLAGRFLIVNQRFEAWHGLETKEAVGRTAGDLLPDDVAELYLAHGGQSGGRGHAHEDEIEMRFADGTVHTLLTTRFAVRAGDGGLIGVGTIATDVSERRQAEEHLRQAQKMEALGRLTGGIAHDFNNLLAVIYGNLSLITEEIDDDAALKELIDDAAAAARSGSDLTHRLLALGNQQALRPQPTDLGLFLTQFARVLERALGEAIEIELSVADDLWPINVDRGHLETSILNLALNGRDAMPDGGLLKIEATNVVDHHANSTEVIGVEAGAFVGIAVSDTGIGMAPDVQARAVQPFFTTKGKDGGSGLGLSMVYGFAQQSGGHLDIESLPNRGTTMRLRLPRAFTETRDAKGNPASPATVPRQGGTILLVEDRPAVRRLAKRILTKQGYDVLEAGDGQSALRVLENRSEIDLLFTDIILPGGMSGIELVAQATAKRPKLKLLYMSGYAPERHLDQEANGPDIPMVRKPFDTEDLLDVVEQVLNETNDRAGIGPR